MPSPPDGLLSTDVDLAVARLRHGGLVALPTETVYGLAGDAENVEAVARIYAVKGRPTGHPLIVHLALETWAKAADEWVADRPPAADRLAAACWPGPLTMLLRRGPRVSDAVTGGLPTVGIRVPGHPIAQSVLARFGGGLAAPSANLFGRVSPTTARHVLDDLGDRLDAGRDLVLDGDSSSIGVESTIVDLTVDPPQVLRAGAITADEIEHLLATPVAGADGPSRASGMLASHYAPDCEIHLVDTPGDATTRCDRLRSAGSVVDVLDRTGDPVAFAQHLYDDLRAADRRGLDALVVVLPAAEGLGLAIRDRLLKAAAHRVDRRRGPTSPGG